MGKYMSLKDFDYDTQYFFKITENRKMNNISKMTDLIQSHKTIDNCLDAYESEYLLKTEGDDEQWLTFMLLRGLLYNYDKLTYELLGIPYEEDYDLLKRISYARYKTQEPKED